MTANIVEQTYEQLLQELAELRQRLAQLETLEVARRQENEEREHLLAAERKQRSLAEALHRAGAELSGTLDFEELLDRILNQLNRVLPNDAADLMLLEGEVVRTFRSRGYEKFGFEQSIASVTYSIGDTYNLRRMRETRQPLAIPYVEEYRQWIARPGLDWIKSQVGAPICFGERVIGFLNVNSSTPGFFSHKDAERLHAFADYAAIALENARLYSQAQQEVRERKRTEQALQETLQQIELAKQEWEATIDSLSQLVCLLDGQGQVLRANRTIARWGLSRVTTVKGMNIHELLHPHCADPNCYLKTFWAQSWKRLVQGYSAETEAEDKILQRHVLIQVRPVIAPTEDKPKVIASFAVAVFNDITARRQAEQKLRESEARNQALLQAIPDSIFRIGRDNTFLDLIPGSGLRLPMDPPQLVGRNLSEVFSLQQAQQITELIERVRRTQQARSSEFQFMVDDRVHDYEIRLVTGDGEEVLMFVRDITHRKQTEAELRQHRDQLEELIAERTAETVRSNQELQHQIYELKRTEEHFYQRNQGLVLLNHIVIASADRMELTTALETTCRVLGQVLGLPQGFALLLNESRTEGRLVARYQAEAQADIPLPESIWVDADPPFQYLLQHRAPLVVNDANLPGDDETLAPIYQTLLRQGVTSLILVPILKESHVLGSLGLLSARPHHFSGHEIELTHFVVNQLVEALSG
ncbi:MAG: GAF domain-containing protein [Chloroflexota bacterium]